MKLFEKIARLLKLVLGWFLVVVSTVVLVDQVISRYEGWVSTVAIFLVLDAAGALLLRSARKAVRKAEKKEEQEAAAAVERERVFVTVECPRCGASVRLEKRKSGFCEYCGSAVSENSR